jgi:nucleoside-diphosphate-sugar epimerase
MTRAALRVLLTNVDTPLGDALLQTLLREPDVERVIAWRSGPRAADAATDPRVRYEQLDLHHDRELWRALFGAARELEINCVIHDPIALFTGHRPQLDWPRVIDESRRLLLYCTQHSSIRHFVLRSSIEVYRLAADLPVLIQEEHPLDLASSSPRVRSLVETDFYACSRAIQDGLQIAVVRCAEGLAAGIGSDLFDYLCAPLCLRPLGFDPMLNLISVQDTARALAAAAFHAGRGVFNAPGCDVLPLSRLIALTGRRSLPLPGGLLSPLYRLRAAATGAQFYYPGHARRFHHGSILDGRHAAQALDYRPQCAIEFGRLALEIEAHVQTQHRKAKPTRP